MQHEVESINDETCETNVSADSKHSTTSMDTGCGSGGSTTSIDTMIGTYGSSRSGGGVTSPPLVQPSHTCGSMFAKCKCNGKDTAASTRDGATGTSVSDARRASAAYAKSASSEVAVARKPPFLRHCVSLYTEHRGHGGDNVAAEDDDGAVDGAVGAATSGAKRFSESDILLHTRTQPLSASRSVDEYSLSRSEPRSQRHHQHTPQRKPPPQAVTHQLQHPDIPFTIVAGNNNSGSSGSNRHNHRHRIGRKYSTSSVGGGEFGGSSVDSQFDDREATFANFSYCDPINVISTANSTAVEYETTADKDEAQRFLRDFGIFGPMGNGVSNILGNHHHPQHQHHQPGNHLSQLARAQQRKDSSKTVAAADFKNGNVTAAVCGVNRRNDYDRLQNAVVRLERDYGELESQYHEVQGELSEVCKELQSKEEEVLRLQREVHKLKCVLQQKTNRSKDEDILSSLQELHCMANRVPPIPSIGPMGGTSGIGGGTASTASKKQGVSAESSDTSGQTDIKICKYDKDFRSKQLIKDAIMDNDFLKNLDSLQVREIVDAMYPKEFLAGSYVLQEGEAGAHLYVSAEGELEVIKDNKVLGSMGSGKAFGELAILYNCTRTASIRVVVNSKVWVLDRKVFQHIMVRTGLQRLEENINFLQSVPLLKDLNKDLLAKIADVLEIEFYPSGAYIIRQGASGDTFFIISSGSVRITQQHLNQNSDDQLNDNRIVVEEEEIRILHRGDYFGEQALLKEEFRTASVIALEPGVECLTLDRDSFIQLIGDLSELKQKDYGDELRCAIRPLNSLCGTPDIEFDYIKLDDLDVIATLGIGGFGRVELVQYAQDKNLTFALKCLKKQHIVDTQQQEHVFSEKQIMLTCRNKFICRLYRSYRDAKYVYMLLEACLGGEVWTILRDRGSFDDRTTTFISACVVTAFEYLHGRGIIYRDLKPENLLMDAKGYVKLVDFGFAKRISRGSKTWTFCGTPEYVAPETILNRGHDRAVDYWALGVLMHELLTGNPPFSASDPMTTYNLILKGIDMIDFGRYSVSRSAQSLIKKLCRDSPSERLGYQRNGIQDIKKHKWFQGFDWDGLNNGTLPAPIVKGVRSPRDISNFDCYTKDADIPPDELSNWDCNF